MLKLKRPHVIALAAAVTVAGFLVVVAPAEADIDESWNFQPAASAVPSGFTADTGAAYSAALGRGWVTQASAGTAAPVPVDLTTNTRDRNRTGIAQEYDTMIHMQYGDTPPPITKGNPAPGAWERVVPNGSYTVTVAVGDQPSNKTTYDSQHVIRAEGLALMPIFQATAANEYSTVTSTVVVNDGKLSIDAVGGRNTKLDWIRIQTAGPDVTPPPAPTGATVSAGNARVTVSWTGNLESAGYRVFRGTSLPVSTSGTPVSGDTPVPATTFTDTTVVSGTTYYYAVIAVDAAGNVSGPATTGPVTAQSFVGVSFKVDFGTDTMTPVTDYLVDYGQPYGARTSPNQGTGRTYGWVEQDEGSAALSLVGNGRVRGRTTVDPRLDSFIHVQYSDVGGTAGVNARGAWEAAVPDGTYEVTVGVGDQVGSVGSVNVVNVEAASALLKFVNTSTDEYRTVTTTVAVRDGRLTVSAAGGTNTKFGYIDVTQVLDKPRITGVRPANRTTGADVNGGVAANIAVPGLGVGVDASTLTTDNVELYEFESGAKVVGSSNTSGGNDTVNFAPTLPLKPFTAYRFVVNPGVKANDGVPFLPFQSVFTTGSDSITAPASFTPVTGVSFEKIEQPAAAGNYVTSMAFGPDGKLYGTTIGGALKRWTVAPDGTLSNQENLTPSLAGRAIIGLVFDSSATAGNLKAWVTHATASLDGEATEWSSKVSLLSGPALATVTDVFVGLPRSQKDHLTNGIHYGPGGDLYFLQGSNQAAGDPDSSWGTRGEKLLTAAMLRFDPSSSQVQAVVAGGAPINVQTSDIASPYDPYASGAPLKIYATGIRNAFDFVYHSGGHMFAPTNGTAGGGNSPGIDVTYSAGVLMGATRKSDPSTPTASTLNDTNLLPACQARLARQPGVTLVDVPPVFNHSTQRDFLFDVVSGGFYGHPNPLRCEFVLNNGGLATGAGASGTKYASSVQPDPNYRGWAYDFEFNKSPDGAIEYRSNTFGGQLKGRLVVARFSNNNDLDFLQVDPANGKILGAQTAQGITGVANSAIGGVDGFLDPLEVVENPANGNLYVSQYDQSGGQPKVILLRVPATQALPTLTAAPDELVFSSIKTATDGPKSITVTNTGTDAVPLATTLSGPDAALFTIGSGAPTTVEPGTSVTITVKFVPDGAIGYREAVLTVGSGTKTDTIALYGLSATAQGGTNEPTLSDVLKTVGTPVNVGWTGLAGGVSPTLVGDEVNVKLFQKAGTAPVGVTPIASYAPTERLPYGWYTPPASGIPTPNQLGVLQVGEQQELLPSTESGEITAFDPGTASFGFYYTSAYFNRTAYTEDSRNPSSFHRARVYPAKNRAGALVPNSYVVAFEDADTGDYQDYVFLITGVAPASGSPTPTTTAPTTTAPTTTTPTTTTPATTAGVLTSLNPEAAPFADRYVFSRVEADPNRQLPLTKVTNTVALKNTGTATLTVSGLAFSGTGAFVIDTGGPTLPATVTPGSTLSVPIKFTGVSGTASNLLIQQNLVVTSNASNGPTTTVKLAGVVADRPEGGIEPSVATIVAAFGFGTTIVGPGQSINNHGAVAPVGDELVVPYWQKLDTGKPVTIRQLAAFHSCCTAKSIIYTYSKGATGTSNRLTVGPSWGQSVLPRKDPSTTSAGFSSFTPSSAVFGFKIDSEWGDPNKNVKTNDQCDGKPKGKESATCKLGLHVRIWPAKDAAGVVIPGSYIMVMDYSGGGNHDFNDNIYLLGNIQPEVVVP